MCIKTIIRDLSQVAHAIHADVTFSENCYHYIYASRMEYLFVTHGNSLNRTTSAGCTKWSLLFLMMAGPLFPVDVTCLHRIGFCWPWLKRWGRKYQQVFILPQYLLLKPNEIMSPQVIQIIICLQHAIADWGGGRREGICLWLKEVVNKERDKT